MGSAPRGLGGGAIATVAANGGGLVLNLFSGVIQARGLGTSGRGTVALILAWAFMWQFLVNVGFREGLVFVQSTGRSPARQVRRLGLASAVVLGGIGFGLAQLVIGPGFGAQAPSTIQLARWAMMLIPAILIHETLISLAAAGQRFVLFGMARFAQPALFTATLVLLASFERLTVSSTLIAIGGTHLAASAFVWVAIGDAHRDADQAAATSRSRSTLASAGRFGFRSFGYSLGGVANARLDLLLMSAVLAASQAGIYQVAVSVASVVAGLFMPLRHVVFAAAARRGDAHGAGTVASMARTTLVVATAVSGVLGLLAPRLIELAYGPDYGPSAHIVRLLLPGIVLWTASGIIAGGLHARNRPGDASRAQLSGLLVTVVGLACLLGGFGITGAAIVSTLSYATVFLVAVRAYLRCTGERVAEFWSPRALLDDLRTMTTLVPRRLGSPA